MSKFKDKRPLDPIKVSSEPQNNYDDAALEGNQSINQSDFCLIFNKLTSHYMMKMI